MDGTQTVAIGGVKYHARIARVESAELAKSHGHAVCLVMLDYGGEHQGFGQYSLDEWYEPWSRRRGTAAGMDYLIRLLAVFKAEGLSELRGRHCLALFADPRHAAAVVGLKALPTEGGTFFLVRDWVNDWSLK